MAFFDLPLEELINYRPAKTEPADMDSFWQATLAEARQFPLSPCLERVDFGLRMVETFDVTFNGWGGQPIKGWLLLPSRRQGLLPCVVEYIGYGGGRGLPHQWLTFSNAGFAHLVMDTRGQGSVWCPGDTPDPEPGGTNNQYPGFMTRGILNPNHYYYRRLFTDAVRAIETARSFPEIDADRIAVRGGSQGGALCLAAASLQPDVQLCLADVPFLCHFRRATQITDSFPYAEIAHYCKTHRDKVETVFHTLAYFDNMNLVSRARAEALFAVGLMDDICPPSTVFAAYNAYAGPKQIKIYEYNNHEGGEMYQELAQIQLLHERWG